MAIFIALAVAAVGGAISSSSKKKSQEDEIQNRIDAVNAQEKARQRTLKSAQQNKFAGQYGFDEIFGTKPEGVDPISVEEGLSRNVSQIRNEGLPAALDFTGQINEQFAGETLDLNLRRINTLIPNFDAQSGQISSVTEQLLNGQLPFDDVLDIVSDRQSLAGTLGTPGGQGAATLKDLGLSRMDAFGTGFNLFSQFTQTLQSAVSPTPQFARGDEILPFTSLTAAQRVQGELATTEALQRAELIRNQADPAAAALFGEEFLFQQDAASTRAGTKVTNNVAADAASAAAGTASAYYSGKASANASA